MLGSFAFISTTLMGKAQSSRVHFTGDFDGQLVGHFTLGSEVYSRTIHAPRPGGWCGLWCSLFPEVPLEYGRDADGDGMTDFEEMVLMQNPHSRDPMPRKLSEVEKAALLERHRLARESRAPRLLTPEEAERIQRGLEVFIEAKRHPLAPHPTKEERLAASRELVRDLREIDQKPDGRTGRGTRGTRRARSMSVDSFAAKLIGADQLWPSAVGVTQAATGADPAPMTGKPALPPLGLWDLGIVNLADNSEPNPSLGFGTQRVTFGDSGSVSGAILDHPSLMAKIIGWDGGDDTLRGLAWESHIKSFDITNDYLEMLEEATNQGMIFSNHSYSPWAGWEKTGSANQPWEWWGPADLAGEDPEFGAYSLNAKTIDSIVYRAQTYLPVFSAGNDATDHGPIVDSTGLIDPADSGYNFDNASYEEDANGNLIKVTTSSDPAVFHPSDSGVPQAGAVRPENLEIPLENYGSGPIGMGLATIRSTGSAKNNLTVGAALADSATVTNSENIWLGVVSSRGPTDDHRLKPDLVASGSFQPVFATSNYGSSSAAAATVTGLLGQLNEINVDGDGPPFLASTWKALLLNTTIDGRNLNHFVADESEETYTRVPTYLGDGGDGPGGVIGPSDADLIGPDPFFGYGMVNAPAAAELLLANLASASGAAHLRQHLLFDPTSEGDNLMIEIPIEHDGTSSEMRILLCWTDPPYQVAAQESLETALFDPDLQHTPNTDARLVNDLDLRVITPAQVELFPWAPDFSSTTAILGPTPTGDNTRDNVEQIVVPAPTPGTYLIQVKHKGTLKSWRKVEGSSDYQLIPNQYQAFSLAISGNLDPGVEDLKLCVDLVDAQAGGDLVNLSFLPVIGNPYQLESSDDLIQWSPEGNPFVATLSPQPLTRFYDQENKAKRFYRIRLATPLGSNL